MSDILISNVTNSSNTGVFDVLMADIEAKVCAQYDAERIKGTDFATVYLGALQATLTESIKFAIVQEKAGFDADEAEEKVSTAQKQTELVTGQVAKVYADVALVGQQQETERAQTTDPTGGHMLAKQNLIDAQTLGFASDTKQKILKQMMEGFAVTLSVAGVATVPDAAQEPAIDALAQEILNDVGTTVAIP